MYLSDFGHHHKVAFFCFLVNVSTTIGWIVMKFGADIHGAKRMSPNDFGDPLTFDIVPPAGQSFHISSGISQHLLYGLAKQF